MRRCYEREHWQNQFGKFDYYHCGNGNTINGIRYCLQDCTLGEYFGWCACKDPPEEKIEQMTLFEEDKDGKDDKR